MTPEEKKRLINVEIKIDKIINLLGGDEDLHTIGFIERVDTKVDSIDKTLSEFLVREKVYKAKAATWGIIGGAVGTILLWISRGIIAKLI